MEFQTVALFLCDEFTITISLILINFLLRAWQKCLVSTSFTWAWKYSYLCSQVITEVTSA